MVPSFHVNSPVPDLLSSLNAPRYFPVENVGADCTTLLELSSAIWFWVLLSVLFSWTTFCAVASCVLSIFLFSSVGTFNPKP